MNEQQCLEKMIAPGQIRPSKPYRNGVIQILVTSSCDKACYGCTQLSQLSRPFHSMSPEHFEQALESLAGYFGVYGLFGGNPAISKHFFDYCDLLEKYVPRDQRGIWCNNPLTLEKAQRMREVFDHRISNLNVHLDQKAYDLFKQGWPECNPVGLHQDSRHSPPFVAMKDVLRKECPDCAGQRGVYVTPNGDYYHSQEPESVWQGCDRCGATGSAYDDDQAWELISNCDINQNWSAGIGVFRNQLRAWFCEVAMAQSLAHQDESDYPDTGLDPIMEYEMKVRPGERLETTVGKWWQLPMPYFAGQVRKHCHECSVPLRGYGELSQAGQEGKEQTSATHANIYKPKRAGRQVEVVTDLVQLGTLLKCTTRYLQNSGV